MAQTEQKPEPNAATKAPAPAKAQGARKQLVGEVVSTKMQKTIVVEVHRRKSHALYARVIKRRKRFYAHDEQNSAHVGDVVRIEEASPLSKLKRWQLKEAVRRATLVRQENTETAAEPETHR